MCSLLGTCKLHGMEPFAYLSDVIARISDHKANKLYELLPQNWQPLAK
ncbi:MAG: transposase domain-containing protein [Flavobacteriales bacterium]|nr:transposase domain-containing protein [Flavobacteriales bacterium]